MRMIDNVNHHQHYEGHTSLECIDVMEMMFGSKAVAYFCACNAFKYLWRYKNKNGQEDLEKAMWYIKRLDEWREFCRRIETLPYAQLITGEVVTNGLFGNQEPKGTAAGEQGEG